jgi:hypothetical protein
MRKRGDPRRSQDDEDRKRCCRDEETREISKTYLEHAPFYSTALPLFRDRPELTKQTLSQPLCTVFLLDEEILELAYQCNFTLGKGHSRKGRECRAMWSK